MNILWITKYSIYFHKLLSLNKFGRIRCLFCTNFKDEDSDLKKKFKSTWYENQKETNLNEDWVFLTPKFKNMDKLSESVCLLLYIMIYICRYSLYPPPLSRIMRINTVYKSFTWKLYPQVRTTYSLGLDILPLKPYSLSVYELFQFTAARWCFFMMPSLELWTHTRRAIQFWHQNLFCE